MSSTPMREPRRSGPVTLRMVVMLSAVLTVVLLLSFVFSGREIGELESARKRVETLEAEIERLEAENVRLRDEIDAVRKSTFAVEKIAREDLGMSKPGELVYMLPKAQ